MTTRRSHGTPGNLVGRVALTFLNLKRLGFESVPPRPLPNKGILLMDWDTNNQSSEALAWAMIIPARSDGMVQPSAHFNVLHNASMCDQDRHCVWNPHFIPHRLIPGLIQRNPDRGLTRTTVGSIGHPNPLAPQWVQRLRSIGLEWVNMDNLHLWHDLSAMDILVEASTASRLTRILMRLKSILGIDRYWQDRSGILRNHWPEDQARR